VWRFLSLQLEDVVLEAVVSCSHKTVHYALLLGELSGNLVAPMICYSAAGQVQ